MNSASAVVSPTIYYKLTRPVEVYTQLAFQLLVRRVVARRRFKAAYQKPPCSHKKSGLPCLENYVFSSLQRSCSWKTNRAL